MCTRNRTIALVLSLCLLISAVPVSAGAAEDPVIRIDDMQTYPGNYVYVNVQAEMLENLASLDLEIYYDSSAMIIRETWDGELLSGCVTSVNRTTEGVIKLSTATNGSISGSGVLLTLVFEVYSDCPAGDYPLVVSVGEAYDTTLNPATIRGVSGSVRVDRSGVDIQTFYMWSSADRYELICNDVVTLHLYSSGGYGLASSTFLAEYDSDLFELVEASLSYEMKTDDAVYTINTDIPGIVRVAYASSGQVFPYELLNLKLRVRQNVDAQTTVRFAIGEAYDEGLNLYQDSDTTMTLQLRQSVSAADQPDLYLETEQLNVGCQSNAALMLGPGAPVAAADFFVNYDPSVLRCVSVTVAEDVDDSGGMVTINPNFDNGAIRFSYINESGYAGGLTLVKIVWEPICSPDIHTCPVLGGTNIIDQYYKTVQLDMISKPLCVFVEGKREPSCLHNGFEGTGCMGCGKTLSGEIVPALGHDYEANDYYWSCYEPGYTEYVCSRCGDTYQQSHTEAPGHDWGEWYINIPPCQEGGGSEYHWCNRCGYYEEREVPKKDHNYSEWYVDWQATCYSTGQDYRYCMWCGMYEYRETPLIDHDYEVYIVDPSCEWQGYTTHRCRMCGDYFEDNYQAPLGHDWDEGTVIEPATEWSSGTIRYQCYRCSMCEDRVLPPLAHQHAYRSEVTPPTCTNPGYTTYICDGCGDRYVADYQAALDHSYGQWYVFNEASVSAPGEERRDCIRCDHYESREIPQLENPFSDVLEGQYYCDPVMWAVEKGITTGTGDGSTFSPERACTRAQVVTFLWRAAGCPEPQSMTHSFTDVKAGSYYEKAVIWAVENGITSGKGSSTTFQPDTTCNRAEVVTFLWRSKGKPTPESSSNPFPDVPAGSYYEQAVLWAVENGITTGKGNGNFAPTESCTRAHVVTFLYRAFAEE